LNLKKLQKYVYVHFVLQKTSIRKFDASNLLSDLKVIFYQHSFDEKEWKKPLFSSRDVINQRGGPTNIQREGRLDASVVAMSDQFIFFSSTEVASFPTGVSNSNHVKNKYCQKL